MGCDIHLFIEKRHYRYDDKEKQKGVWVNQDKYSENKARRLYDANGEDGEREMEINRNDSFYTHGRNYNLFCALAGVRSYEFKNEPPRVSEPKGLPKDISPITKAESDRYGSDGHSHSWLTLKELQEFDWSSYGQTCDNFRNDTMQKMAALGDPEDVRIVFFFDN